jgi:large subunit ribosomal protein L10
VGSGEPNMPISKNKKKELIEELKEKLSKQKALVFVDFTGVKVKDFFAFRKKLKEDNNELKVMKKTLAQIAFKEKGINVDIKKMQGEMAFIFGYKDEISSAKKAWQFSLENKNFKILGGIVGNEIFDVEKMTALAQLPSKEELLGRLVGSIAAPISGFENVLIGNIRGLVQVLNQISKGSPST